jgi:hypothetical protein
VLVAGGVPSKGVVLARELTLDGYEVHATGADREPLRAGCKARDRAVVPGLSEPRACTGTPGASPEYLPLGVCRSRSELAGRRFEPSISKPFVWLITVLLHEAGDVGQVVILGFDLVNCLSGLENRSQLSPTSRGFLERSDDFAIVILNNADLFHDCSLTQVALDFVAVKEPGDSIRGWVSVQVDDLYVD